MKTLPQLRARVQKFGPLGKWRAPAVRWTRCRGFYLKDHYTEVVDALRYLSTKPYNAFNPKRSWENREYGSFLECLWKRTSLDEVLGFEHFRSLCYLSVLGHDLGKYGGEFQMMLWSLEDSFRIYLHKAFPGQVGSVLTRRQAEITGINFKPARYSQRYRHEFLSLVMLRSHPELRAWFAEKAGGEKWLAYVEAAAFAHHLKTSEQKAVKSIQGPVAAPFPVFLSSLSDDFQELLGQPMAWPFDISGFPSMSDWTPAPSNTQEWRDLLTKFETDTPQKADDNLSRTLKWVTLLADTMGSITSSEYRQGSDSHLRVRGLVYAWFDSIFAETTGDNTLRALRGRFKRTKGGDRSVEDAWLRRDRESLQELLEDSLRPAQRKAGRSTNLLCALNTGAGKTMASLYWSCFRPSPTILCGTTTDAVTEHRNTYGFADDALKHSRAAIEFVDVPDDPFATPQQGDRRNAEAEGIVRTFRHYHSPILFTTADHLLGLMAFYRSSVMRLPQILKSQIIFDEIGSYDPVMRGWHKLFLETFPDIPVAHLSATIPQKMQDDLVSLTDKRHGRHRKTTIIHSTDRKGAPYRQPRWRIHVLPDESLVAGVFGQGFVLFTNTVARSQDAARIFGDALLHHSRFRLKDRRRNRDFILEHYHPDARPDRRLISTQVAQQAHDFSAWGGIFEVAPIHEIIQRLGRVNRKPLCTRVADVYLFTPSMRNGHPYVQYRDFEPQYRVWADFFRQFKGVDVSYKILTEAFHTFYNTHPWEVPATRERNGSFLKTRRLSVRQSIPTEEVLLPQDVHRVKTFRDALLHQVPVLLSRGQRQRLLDEGKLLRDIPGIKPHRLVVDAAVGTYDDRLGFLQ